MSTAYNHAVIAIALNYSWIQHAIFVLPLRAKFDGDIILYTEPPSQMAAGVFALNSEHRVRLVTMQHRCMGAGASNCSASWMVRARFAMYAAQCRGYQQCLAVDFRDVTFQADPFAALAQLNAASKPPRTGVDDLTLSCEDARMRVRQSRLNKMWLIDCISYEFYRQVENRRCILNSGTIMGTPRAFARVAEVMATPCRIPFDHGSDQALLMWSLHAKQLGNLSVNVQERGKGVVNTLRYALPWLHTLVEPANASKQGQWPDVMPWTVYNNDHRSVSAVVHQYDVTDECAGYYTAIHTAAGERCSAIGRLRQLLVEAAQQWQLRRAAAGPSDTIGGRGERRDRDLSGSHEPVPLTSSYR